MSSHTDDFIENWAVVFKQLKVNSVSVSTIYKAFERVDGNRVRIKDVKLAEQMLSGLPDQIRSGDTKVEAAKKGNAHRGTNKVGMLMLYPAGVDHPVVACCDEAGFILPVPPSKRLLIIENMHLFYHCRETAAFVSEHCPDLPIQGSFDIAFGSGAQINAGYFQPLLSSYDEIFCLFDVDLGGLKIYRGLTRSLPAIPITFLIPRHLNELLTQSRRSLKEDDRIALYKMTGLTGRAEFARNTILSTNNTLEQEVYLG